MRMRRSGRLRKHEKEVRITNKEKLAEYAEKHLFYQIQQAHVTKKAMMERKPMQIILHNEGDVKKSRDIFLAIKNGVVESFAMNTRNLIEFLTSDSKSKKHLEADARAYDYFDSPDDWKKYLHSTEGKRIIEMLRQLKEKASKLSAHPSYERLTANMDWTAELQKFEELVVPLLKKFVSEAKQELIPKNVRELVDTM